MYDAIGRKRRLGFGRSKGGIGIHRSEEILPGDLRLAASQGGSSISSEDMSASQDVSDRYILVRPFPVEKKKSNNDFALFYKLFIYYFPCFIFYCEYLQKKHCFRSRPFPSISYSYYKS